MLRGEALVEAGNHKLRANNYCSSNWSLLESVSEGMVGMDLIVALSEDMVGMWATDVLGAFLQLSYWVAPQLVHPQFGRSAS